MCVTCSGARCFGRFFFCYKPAQSRAKHPVRARLSRPASHRPAGEDRTEALQFQYQTSSSATPGRAARRPSWPSPAGRSPVRPGWPWPSRAPEAQCPPRGCLGNAVPSSWSPRQEVMDETRRPGSDGSAGRTERPPGSEPPSPGLPRARHGRRGTTASPSHTGGARGPPGGLRPPLLTDTSPVRLRHSSQTFLCQTSLYWRTNPSFSPSTASFMMVSAAPLREQLQGAGFSLQPTRQSSSPPRMCTLVLWHFHKASWLKTQALKNYTKQSVLLNHLITKISGMEENEKKKKKAKFTS